MAAASMKGVSFTGSYEVGVEVKEKKFKSSEGLACKNELKGRKVLLREQSGSFASWNPKTQSCSSITVIFLVLFMCFTLHGELFQQQVFVLFFLV